MYFKEFPVLSYRNLSKEQKDNTRKIARDIVRRIAFSKRLKDEASLYQNYIILEGERPEHVALKVYGNEEYHWVVLLFNEILNPYYEWPLSDQALENYIEKKYPGEVLYCTSLTVNERNGYTGGGDNFSGLTHAANETVFQWDGTTDDFGNAVLYQSDQTRGLVWDFKPQLGALEVINTEGTWNEGDILVKVIDNDTFQYAQIQKVGQNKHGVHHFELEGATAGEELWIDPLVSSEGIPIGQTGAGPANNPYGTKVVGGTGGGANVVSAVSYTQTMIAQYTGCGPSNDGTLSNSIANDVYEIRENDRKREIKLLDPRYLELVITEFESKMKQGSTRTIFNAPRRRRKNY